MRKKLEDYRGIVPDEVLADLHRRVGRLYDKHVVHVNSTSQGGGVAELLYSIVPLMNDVGLYAGWRVLPGSNDFFSVTKKFHNGMQGENVHFTDRKMRLYTETNENFAAYTHIHKHDAVVIHDPQPLPVIAYYRKRQPWIWRCHIDISSPDPVLWDYLKGFVLRYDLMVVSHPSYVREDLPVEQRVINPAIDPLNEKNDHLSDETVHKYMQKFGVPLDKPLITQVSRFDKWKDPLGVLDVFERVREEVDCRLVLCGNAATDDPEGAGVFEEVSQRAARFVESGDVILLTQASDIAVNALQRVSSVVMQKSTREGFGLTVSEALWKGTPVVASAVGGIPLQVIDGKCGYLVQPGEVDECARKVTAILKDREMAEEMGRYGKEHVRENFLVTRLLGHWLSLFDELIGG